MNEGLGNKKGQKNLKFVTLSGKYSLLECINGTSFVIPFA